MKPDHKGRDGRARASSQRQYTDARVTDEMAVTLCSVPELGDDAACIIALARAGFPQWRICKSLNAARRLARAARAVEADIWNAALTRLQ